LPAVSGKMKSSGVIIPKSVGVVNFSGPCYLG